jgi:rubrerythrin
MTAREQVLEVLRRAYHIEVEGQTFYALCAHRAEKPAVRELFEKLAADEVQHQVYLRQVLGKYAEHGVAAFEVQRRQPDLGSIANQLFTERFRREAQGASFEMAVLSIGMQLESNALTHFSSSAAGSSEPEVAGFYRFLADWEKEHYDALATLSQSIRADFWDKAGFAPF